MLFTLSVSNLFMSFTLECEDNSSGLPLRNIGLAPVSLHFIEFEQQICHFKV